MKCKCGKEIEITVPMFIDGKGNFICKDCFENKKEINGLIATAEGYIKKFQKVIERRKEKKNLNDQLDLLIDDFIELLRELRSTQKPLPKERKDYFLEKLEKRSGNKMEIQIKEHEITPNQKVIEIHEGDNLIATIIPRITMISIVSRYIKNVEKDMAFPPKIILNLKERSE